MGVRVDDAQLAQRRVLALLAAVVVCVAVVGCGGGHRAAGPASTAGSVSSSAGGSGAGATSGQAGRSATTPGASARRAPGPYGDLATFGSPAGGEERAVILASARAYLQALAAGDWAGACARLSSILERQLAMLLAHAKGHPHGCPAALGMLLGRAPAAARRAQAQIAVVAVRVAGDRAFVLYRSAQQPHEAISMVRQDGAWRAGAIVGSNL